MGKIFWGFLVFVFFDLRLNGIVFTPDFVGYLLVFLGLSDLMESRTVAKYRWTAAVATALAMVEYLMSGFTELAWPDPMLDQVMGLIQGALLIVVTYLVAAGVRDLEGVCHADLNSAQLYKAWLIMTIATIAVELITFAMLLLRSENEMLALLCIIVGFATLIWYMVQVWKSKKALATAREMPQEKEE